MGVYMMQGICINQGQTSVLEKGKSYFLFPNGTQHYYVSNFPNQNAHKGCFQMKYFQLVQKEEWPAEPEMKDLSLDREKVYKANLVWRKPGYKCVQLKDYYVQPKNTHGNFYKDSNLKKFGGCFPLHWFTDFTEVDPDANEPDIFDFVIDSEETGLLLAAIEPETINYVQLSLFE